VTPFTPVHSEGHVTLGQRTKVAELQQRFADVFSHLPGRTVVIELRIETPPVSVCPYRLPEQKRKIVNEELKAMLEMGVIEGSCK